MTGVIYYIILLYIIYTILYYLYIISIYISFFTHNEWLPLNDSSLSKGIFSVEPSVVLASGEPCPHSALSNLRLRLAKVAFGCKLSSRQSRKEPLFGEATTPGRLRVVQSTLSLAWSY